MPKVIVINGMGEVGKSTFISLCHEIDPRVIETSTVDFVKEIALQAGWNGIKDDLGRKFLSDLKDAMSAYHDIPNKKIDEFIQSHPDNIIFVNAREPQNIQYYKDKYNALTLLIENNRIEHVPNNHADSKVKDYKNYNFTIYNNGTLDELKEMANNFMKLIERF